MQKKNFRYFMKQLQQETLGNKCKKETLETLWSKCNKKLYETDATWNLIFRNFMKQMKHETLSLETLWSKGNIIIWWSWRAYSSIGINSEILSRRSLKFKPITNLYWSSCSNSWCVIGPNFELHLEKIRDSQ